jgi:hypothetical protein
MASQRVDPSEALFLRTVVLPRIGRREFEDRFGNWPSEALFADQCADPARFKAHVLGYSDRVMSLSRYQTMLKSSFYFGTFVLHGEMHQGSHEPLVTKQLFDSVQNVMKRRSKPNTTRLKSYVYRGLMYCGECGCVITMETQKGHNYLRCTKRRKADCSQRYLREEKATDQIAEALASASLSDDTADRMIERLRQEQRESDGERQGERQRTEGSQEHRRQTRPPHGGLPRRRGVLGRRVPQAQGGSARQKASPSRQDGRDARGGRITVRTGHPVRKWLETNEIRGLTRRARGIAGGDRKGRFEPRDLRQRIPVGSPRTVEDRGNLL